MFSDEQLSILTECHDHLQEHLKRWSDSGFQHLTPAIAQSSQKQVNLWEKLMHTCKGIVQESRRWKDDGTHDGAIPANMFRQVVGTLPDTLVKVYHEFLNEQELTANWISPAASIPDDETSTRAEQWAQYLGSLARECEDTEQDSVPITRAMVGRRLPRGVSLFVDETLTRLEVSNMDEIDVPESIQELKQTIASIERSISSAQMGDVRDDSSLCTPQ
ncbi:hypothetical protein QFC20_007770 [Naganishia adeliensis]|uniref:Uncharacterized protein n=1 Tax=Naganishia adeliensis TaxID=92952 RepID=A0ACC2UW59_9TREE|nr:hypothetical protein QFC20_007770 [Naganishia adeliensis]